MLSLTKREKQVFDLLQQGMAREDICKSINISRVNLRDIIRRLKKKSCIDSKGKPSEIGAILEQDTPVVKNLFQTTSPGEAKLPGTIDGLAEYIVKNIHEAQERDKKLMDAQRKMGQLIEREFIEYGLHPSVKYQDWVKSTRHQKITQNNFYYSRLLVAVPEFNVLSESTDKDYFLENRTAHKFWSIIVLNISQSDHAFDKLIRCIELFREGRNNADIARELRWNEGRVENARNILVNLRVLKREKT